MLPAAVTVAGPTLVIARSATGVTVVFTESVLLPGTGSAVVAPMVALFVSVAPWAGALTTMVSVVVDPVAQVARVQVTEMLRLLLQLQPPLDGVTDTKLTPAGKVSVTFTLLASDGPAL